MIRIGLVIISFLLFSIASLTWAGTVQLPRTGENTCWVNYYIPTDCTGTGQDGETQDGVEWPNPRFIDHGNGEITDKLTGLVWVRDFALLLNRDPDFRDPSQHSLDSGYTNFHGALNYVKKLNAENYLGHNDWRLPNLNELRSLANYGLDPSQKALWLQEQGFINIPQYPLSSASIFQTSTAGHVYELLVDMLGGGGYGDAVGNAVLPVRTGVTPGVIQLPKTGLKTCFNEYYGLTDCAGTGQDGELQLGVEWPNPRFTDHGNGVITDNLTGLGWAKDATLNFDMGPDISWLGCSYYGLACVLEYLKKLNDESYLGHNDWRLPNLVELLSLVDYSRPFSRPVLPEGHPFIIMPDSKIASSSIDYHGMHRYDSLMGQVFDIHNGYHYDYFYDFVSYLAGINIWPVRGSSGSAISAPKLEVSQEILDFGYNPTGECSSKKVLVSNSGDAPLIIEGVSVSDLSGVSIQLDISDIDSCMPHLGEMLQPDQFCTVTVDFCPFEEGEINGELVISSNDPNLSKIVSIVGNVQNPPEKNRNWIIVIDGMDIPATFLYGPNMPSIYLYEAISQLDREKITEKGSVLTPFSWSRNTYDTNSTVEKLYEKIKYYIDRGETVSILSHSWGSVLSYLALKKHNDIHIENFITLGSPLNSQDPFVRTHTGNRIEEAGVSLLTELNNVKKWTNYYISCDPVSYKINFKSRDCRNYKFDDSIFDINPLNCHRSYFDDLDKLKIILKNLE